MGPSNARFFAKQLDISLCDTSAIISLIAVSLWIGLNPVPLINTLLPYAHMLSLLSTP